MRVVVSEFMRYGFQKHRSYLLIIAVGLAVNAPAADEVDEQESATLRNPLPEIAAPVDATPDAEDAGTVEAPPPPPLDTGYRAPTQTDQEESQ